MAIRYTKINHRLDNADPRNTLRVPLHASGSLIEVSQVRGSSRLTRCKSVSPLKILHPATINTCCQVYLSNYGGGLLQGDHINLDIMCNPETKFFLGSQSETKLYLSKGGKISHQQVTGRVGANALAVIAPSAVIPFAGSRFTQGQYWHLNGSSEFLLVDWVHEGRSALQEKFRFNLYQSEIHIYIDGKKLIVDRLRLEPSVSFPQRIGAFGPYTSLLNLYAVGRRITSKIRETVKVSTDYKKAQERWVVMNEVTESASVVRVMSKVKAGVNQFLENIFVQLASGKYLGLNPSERKF